MLQYTPEYTLSQNTTSNATLSYLTRGQAIGLSLRIETGFISLIAILVVYGLVCRNVYRHWRVAPRGSWRLFEGPADIYMIALFAFDLLQSLGRTLDIRWVTEGKVYAGTYCNVAGAVQQIGETGSAQITLAIAVHTFITVWCKKGAKARTLAALIVLVVCLYTSLYVGIGIATHKDPDRPYDGPSPYWCWIGSDKELLAERITGEYMWLWITLVVSFLLYVPMFFFARGNITIEDKRWWRFSVHAAKDSHVRMSIGMLAYPVVYALTVLPLSVGRWYGFTQPATNPIPSAVTFTVSCLFGLTGLFNVLLLFARPSVLLFDAPDPAADNHKRLLSGAPPGSRTPSPAHGRYEKPAPRRRAGPPRALPGADSDSEDEEERGAVPMVPLPAAPIMRTLTHDRSPGPYGPYVEVGGMQRAASRAPEAREAAYAFRAAV